MKCFNGHEVPDGIPVCDICGATAYDDIVITDPQQCLITLQERNAILLKWLVNIKVTNVGERKSCGDMLITGRRALKDAKEKLSELTEPYKKDIKKIKDAFDPFIDKLETGLTSINKAMSAYDLQQEKAVDTETGEITAVSLPKTTHANAGDFSFMDSFDVIVTAPKLVPRQYCDPSLVKLRAAFKSGVEEIPGVLKQPKKIYQTRSK